MRPLSEPVSAPKPQKPTGFLGLVLTTPVYLVSIICWFVLVWLTLLDLEGTPVQLPLAAALVTHTYPVTVLSAVGAGWLGFFSEQPRLARLAPLALPLHVLATILTLAWWV